jgi:hypothetical protein
VAAPAASGVAFGVAFSALAGWLPAACAVAFSALAGWLPAAPRQ